MAKVRHDKDIVLAAPPLGEAWIEVRWQLRTSQSSGLLQDPDFPYALGLFYKKAEAKYKIRKDLDIARAPADLFPHVVRHQFWTSEGEWPVLQLGPGVASVNLTKPYTWTMFRSESQFMLETLVEAYGGSLPPTDSVMLRYQNAEEFDFLAADVTEFLSTQLNTSIRFPSDIPGEFGVRPYPIGFSLQTEFELSVPVGTATINISTGMKGVSQGSQAAASGPRIIVWQFEVTSRGSAAPSLTDIPSILLWLDSAHDVVHEWFLSFVNGSLLSRYRGESV